MQQSLGRLSDWHEFAQGPVDIQTKAQISNVSDRYMNTAFFINTFNTKRQQGCFYLDDNHV